MSAVKIELVGPPRIRREGELPLSVSLTLRVCAGEVRRVRFEWRSEFPEIGGLTSPQTVGADECVRLNFELPPHDQALTLALYDADAEPGDQEAHPASGRLLWQEKTYLSLAGEEPELVPRPK